MLIRPALPADGGTVASVHEVARAAYYGTAPPPRADRQRVAMWEGLIADPARGTVLCAEDAGRVVGFLSMGTPMHDDVPAGALELHALHVLPAHWGTGVAAALYAPFPERLGRGTGVLDVWGANARAIRFYERRGWVRDGRSRPGPDDSDCLGMSLGPAGD